MKRSLAQRILNRGKPFTMFHTHKVTKEAVTEAIASSKSMDLDIAIDGKGNPFIGHSLEYYRISGEEQPICMPFSQVLNLIVKADIPITVDCKQPEAWPVVKEVLNQVGPHRCLVHTFASEFKFSHTKGAGHDYPSEWSPIAKLNELKTLYPNVTTAASCKFLPPDTLTNEEHSQKLKTIRTVLKENRVNTVSLNCPDETMSDLILAYFLAEEILLHVKVDNIKENILTKLYVGETDLLKNASEAKELGYIKR